MRIHIKKVKKVVCPVDRTAGYKLLVNGGTKINNRQIIWTQGQGRLIYTCTTHVFQAGVQWAYFYRLLFDQTLAFGLPADSCGMAAWKPSAWEDGVNTRDQRMLKFTPWVIQLKWRYERFYQVTTAMEVEGKKLQPRRHFNAQKKRRTFNALTAAPRLKQLNRQVVNWLDSG